MNKLQFLSTEKVINKYVKGYVNLSNGSISPDRGIAYARRYKIWFAVNSEGELRVSDELLNRGNTWLDALAGDLVNGRIEVADLK